MASNLNRAFMRAYAKDRKQSQPESPSAASPESHDAPRPAAPTAKPQPSTPYFVQAANHPATAPQQTPAPQSIPAPKILSGRYMQTAAPDAPVSASSSRVVAPKPQHSKPVQPSSETDAAAEATRVWQRIDAAHAQQPAHVYASPSRRVTSSVGVGSATGPSRMQARAAAPAAPAHRAAIASEPQPVDLPLLTEGDNFLPIVGDARAVETRRRTVADFLYSAGQISASSARVRSTAAVGASRTSNAPAVDDNSLPSGGFVGNGASALGMTASAETASLPPARTQTATSVSTPLPVRTPTRDASVVQREQPSRMGQILRVDIPRGAGTFEPESRANGKEAAQPIDQRIHSAPATAAAHIADQGTTLEAINLAANEQAFGAIGSLEARVGTEQRRMDRAHELNATERQLRRTKHKIFNPVWEVDTLQWPSVCDTLMTHRAESMAQVAAHLKAACDDGLSVLGVTSAGNGEGRTTVACCLARLAAAHGLNVVLVDLDLDHPTLCLQTNLEIEHDWRDCLNEDVKLEEVAVHSIDDQLTLMPLKARGDRPGLLASEPRIAEILSELAESFELVIVDASRMHSSGNVLSGLAHMRIFDASIIVVDRRNLDQERIEDAVRAVQQAGIESIGIVDNFSNA